MTKLVGHVCSICQQYSLYSTTYFAMVKTTQSAKKMRILIIKNIIFRLPND